ncbi:MAG: chorismate synthase [Bacteroidales bacterium]
MNTFGHSFRISIFGESHGKTLGVVIDGCPAGIAVSDCDFDRDLFRRKSGTKGTTPRIEADKPEIVSGMFNQKTTGAPITILFVNTNIQSSDYTNLIDVPRPGHADFVANKKYTGHNDYRGGGHFSGRLTLGLVAAGVIAKKLIDNINISAEIIELGGIKYGLHHTLLNDTISNNDSLGGVIECKASAVPIGLGEPFFNSIESLISHVIFAIPGVKGVEFGAGFAAAKQLGSQHNDCIINTSGTTKTNQSGGVNGGITNGNSLVFRVAVKPTSSIAQVQRTFNFKKQEMESLVVKGRHDSCIALRIPVVVEAATALVLADLFLQQQQS